jgi:hypothetical protein
MSRNNRKFNFSSSVVLSANVLQVGDSAAYHKFQIEALRLIAAFCLPAVRCL